MTVTVGAGYPADGPPPYGVSAWGNCCWGGNGGNSSATGLLGRGFSENERGLGLAVANGAVGGAGSDLENEAEGGKMVAPHELRLR